MVLLLLLPTMTRRPVRKGSWCRPAPAWPRGTRCERCLPSFSPSFLAKIPMRKMGIFPLTSVRGVAAAGGGGGTALAYHGPDAQSLRGRGKGPAAAVYPRKKKEGGEQEDAGSPLRRPKGPRAQSVSLYNSTTNAYKKRNKRSEFGPLSVQKKKVVRVCTRITPATRPSCVGSRRHAVTPSFAGRSASCRRLFSIVFDDDTGPPPFEPMPTSRPFKVPCRRDKPHSLFFFFD